MVENAPSGDLYEMCLSHFNEPMISFGELARCVGYGETAVDCYILVRKRRGELIWHTCVGGYTFLSRLKGQGYVKAHNGEDWDDLTRMDSELTCAGAPPEVEFLVKMDLDNMEDSRVRRRVRAG